MLVPEGRPRLGPAAEWVTEPEEPWEGARGAATADHRMQAPARRMLALVWPVAVAAWLAVAVKLAVAVEWPVAVAEWRAWPAVRLAEAVEWPVAAAVRLAAAVEWPVAVARWTLPTPVPTSPRIATPMEAIPEIRAGLRSLPLLADSWRPRRTPERPPGQVLK